MATKNGKVDMEIGFSVNKQGLAEMQSALRYVATEAAKPGEQFNAGMQKAIKTSNTLKS